MHEAAEARPARAAARQLEQGVDEERRIAQRRLQDARVLLVEHYVLRARHRVDPAFCDERLVDGRGGAPAYTVSRRSPAAVDAALIAQGRIHPAARAEDVVLHKKDARVLQASLRDPSLFVDALLELARHRSRRARLGRLVHDAGDAGSSPIL